jgi:hypothetical protein
VKLLVICCALAGCVDQVDPRWTLDHDHVVAARATPAGIVAGETARLDALVARAGATAIIAGPDVVAAPLAPPQLQAMVVQDASGWIVTAPADDVLAGTRPALGLAPDAPVPIDLVMTFARPSGDPFYVKKTVRLGVHVDNPVVPPLSFDGGAASDALELPIGRDVYVAIATDARVNWLSSCGDLFQDDVATAYLHADAACDGELAVVVRDADGGVAWRVWPMHAASKI